MREFNAFGKLLVSILMCFFSFSSYAERAVKSLPFNELQDRQLLENPHFDIMVVSFLEVDGEESTNANPPKGKMEVIEILRGSLKSHVIPAVFNSPPIPPKHQKEWIGYTKAIPTEEWSNMLFEGPKIGKRLIVFTQQLPLNPLGHAEIITAYEFSEGLKEMVIREMVPPERSGTVQLPLFLLILGMPLACLILLIVSSKSLNAKPKRLTIFMSLMVFAIYAYYESGISIHTNIRVDLLLIYPVLLGNVAILIVASAQLFQSVVRKRKQANQVN